MLAKIFGSLYRESTELGLDEFFLKNPKRKPLGVCPCFDSKGFFIKLLAALFTPLNNSRITEK
jgi:hypothetical protein